jgi:hypothetical protein
MITKRLVLSGLSVALIGMMGAPPTVASPG